MDECTEQSGDDCHLSQRVCGLEIKCVGRLHIHCVCFKGGKTFLVEKV